MNTKKVGQNIRFNGKNIPWYVLSFAISPILAYLAHNITQVSPSVALLPLAFSVISAGILLVIVYALLRNWQRAAVVSMIFLVMFFLYGHAYSYLKGVNFSGFFVFRHRTLAPIWLILTGLGVWWACRTNFNLQTLTLALNTTGIILFVMPVIQISSGLWLQWNAWRQASQSTPAPLNGGTASAIQKTPDIYYIILDSYGRSDVIQRLYDYDNTGFIHSLEQQGFYVANCSQANYTQTELSLASSLNFNYLNALNSSLVPGNADRSPLWPLIMHSALRQYLKTLGYKTIAFATDYGWTEITDADIYLTPQTSIWELNSFQYALIQTTAGRILLDEETLRLPNTPDDIIRRNTQFALEKLQSIPSIKGPKFIFVHLLSPHSFVFGPNGESIAIDVSTMTPAIFKQGYVDQLIFIDKQIENLMATIIANSSTPPIIIIQGDHGPAGAGPYERVSNLNAYYLPGHAGTLYNTITPVNTFRVVLDSYFGQNLPILPDISRYSTYQDPYNSFEVKNTCSK
jgi:hypothetical protein